MEFKIILCFFTQWNKDTKLVTLNLICCETWKVRKHCIYEYSVTPYSYSPQWKWWRCWVPRLFKFNIWGLTLSLCQATRKREQECKTSAALSSSAVSLKPPAFCFHVNSLFSTCLLQSDKHVEPSLSDLTRIAWRKRKKRTGEAG